MAPAKTARASVKHARIAPNKVRFVLELIRGKHVDEARRVLQFTPKAACHDVLKVLNAAVANAQTTLHVEPDTLFVSGAWADEGITMKRWQPRALGRAYKIMKRTSHITLVVEPKGE